MSTTALSNRGQFRSRVCLSIRRVRGQAFNQGPVVRSGVGQPELIRGPRSVVRIGVCLSIRGRSFDPGWGVLSGVCRSIRSLRFDQGSVIRSGVCCSIRDRSFDPGSVVRSGVRRSVIRSGDRSLSFDPGSVVRSGVCRSIRVGCSIRGRSFELNGLFRGLSRSFDPGSVSVVRSGVG